MIGDELGDDVVGERGGDAEDEALEVEAGEAEDADEEVAVAAALDHQTPQRIPGRRRLQRLDGRLRLPLNEAISQG